MKWMVLLDPSDGTGNAGIGPFDSEGEADQMAKYVWEMTGDVGTDVVPLHEPPNVDVTA